MALTLEEVEQRLRQVLLQSLTEPPEAESVRADVGLVTTGLELDSVALLELVVGIENEFDIQLDDGSLTADHFESLSTLARVIFEKIQQQSS